jgi:polyisoprenyl-phosphate glycosyltransferase
MNSDKNQERKIVTIVIPVYNEALNIIPTLNSIVSNIDKIDNCDFEILFIDDGSTDQTLETIKKFHHQLLKTGYLKLSRNFGHQAALEAGINHAEGDIVITMDGDLQHPASMIPHMIEEYFKGADIVQMQRANIKSDSKGFISVAFYSFFSWVSEAPIVPNAADFRLLSKRVVYEIRKYGGRGKLLRAIVPSLGFKQVLLPYIQPERKYEKAKYTFFKSYELAINTLFKFSTFPQNALLASGSSITLFSVGILILIRLTDFDLSNRYYNLVLTSAIVGIIILCSGIISWYLYLILEQVRSEPPYIIEKSAKPEN